MYHPTTIEPLSKKQVSKLLNGHPVRVKHGRHHKIHLSAEHHKKLHRAHLKGAGITLTLDPYAIAHNQHLRRDVGMLGGAAVSEQMKQSAGTNAMSIMDAGTQRLNRAIAGSGVHHRRHRGGAVSEQMKQSAGTNAMSIMDAGTQRLNRAIAGSGARQKKFENWSTSVGDVLGLNSGTSQAVKKQILGALGNAASSRLQSGVPQAPPPQYTAGQQHQMKRQSRPPADIYSPSYAPPPAPDVPDIPVAQAYDLGLPPLPESYATKYAVADNYAIPTGRLYASGVRKQRAKRVMSEAQKAALAKGRARLRHRLNEEHSRGHLGDGVKHRRRKHAGALMPAGY